jgi:predicted nucleic acid-binding protein
VPSIIVDAGPLIALFDRDDRHHSRAVSFVQGCRSQLISNMPVLTETTLILRFSVDAQRDFLLWAHRALEIDDRTAADLPRIAALLDKYRDVPADFADVSLLALAERLNISQIASVDKDFAIYRLSSKLAFENVFMNSN